MSWLSGGVLFAVGVALWVAYLLPSMLRRRQAQGAEQEAVKLQHALQVLAETGELPLDDLGPAQRFQELKQQSKRERQIERENLRALHRAEEQRKALAKQQRKAERMSEHARRASLIRVRTLAAWVLLLSIATIMVGTVTVFFGVTWMVIGAGVIGAVASITTLRTIVRRLGPGVAVSGQQSASNAGVAFEPVNLPQQSSSRRWTPNPLPAPLHLAEGSAAAATIASNEAVEALRRRAREVAAESAQPPLPSVTAARARAAAMAAHPSSYGMRLRQTTPQARAAAVVGSAPLSPAEQVAAKYRSLDALVELDESTFDVSEVLQRRRAV
ncbi:MAG: hypothetical protein ACKOXM_04050 [Agromyces sp.]